MRQVSPRKWRLRVFAGRTSDGKVHHVNRTFIGTERAARQELGRLSAEVRRGAIDVSGRMTFGELLDRWLEQIEPERSPKTILEYRGKIEKHIRPALGSTRVDRLTPLRLDQQYRQWQDAGVSAATVRHLHRIISAALNEACRWQLIPSNAARLARPPRVEREAVIEVPSPDQLESLLRATEQRGDDMMATAIALAAVTGARRGELCALRWSDVDPSAGTVRIARSVSVIRGELHTGPTKTHAVREVALGALGVETLRRRRQRIEDIADEVGVPLDRNPFILSESPRSGEPISPNILTQRFTALCRTIGAHFRFHDLRHFAATQLVGAGVDVRTVAARLGHADPSLTLRVYAQPLTERDREAADVLGRLLAPALDATN